MTNRTKRKNRKKRKTAWWQAVGQALRLTSVGKRIVVVGGLFVSSIFELLGLTMIIPLLASASFEMHTSKSGITTAIRWGMEMVGLPFDPVIILIAVVVGLSLKAAITISVMRYVSDIVAEIGNDFQIRLFRNLLRAQWSFFIRQPLGRLVHATGPEAGAVGETFMHASTMIASALQAGLFLAVVRADLMEARRIGDPGRRCDVSLVRQNGHAQPAGGTPASCTDAAARRQLHGRDDRHKADQGNGPHGPLQPAV